MLTKAAGNVQEIYSYHLMESSSRGATRPTSIWRNRSNNGGYDYSFVSTELEDYSCSICTKVLRDPHLTSCCGQHYCESCLKRWLKSKRKKTCPSCRDEGFQHFLDKKFKRENIDSLLVKCPYLIHGCMCEIKLGSLKDHLESTDGCPYAMVLCPNKCKLDTVTGTGETSQLTRIKRKDLESHVKEHCLRRPYECEHCGHKGTYDSVTRPFGHYSRCQEMSQVCPNKCGERDIKRKDMSTHRKQCPLERVDCPFKEAGCKITLLQTDMTEHVESSIKDHLLLTTQAFSEINKQKKAACLYVDKTLRECEPDDNREQLEHIRSIFDDSRYIYLRNEGDQLQLKAVASESYQSFTPDVYSGSGNLTYGDNDYIFDVPSVYYGEGYEMEIMIIVKLKTAYDDKFQESGHKDTICGALVVCHGDFYELLEWPIADRNLAINIHVTVDGTNKETHPNGASPSGSSDISPPKCDESFNIELPICSECCVREYHVDLRCLDGYCGHGSKEQDISHAVARKALESKSLSCTLTLGHHDHIKRRKTVSSK